MSNLASLRRYLDLQAELAEQQSAVGHIELQRAQSSLVPWEIESELKRRQTRIEQIRGELDELARSASAPAAEVKRGGGGVGRPSKLSEAMIATIAQAAQAGLYKKDLCAVAGIHPATLNAWLEAGEAEAERVAAGERAAPDQALAYKLALALRRAEAEAKRRRLERLNQAGENGDWRADTWFLEHRFPDEYGRRVELGITPRPMQPFTADEAAQADKEIADWREQLGDGQ